jgi:hypothetical protein
MSKTPPAKTTLSEDLPNSVKAFLSSVISLFFTSSSIFELMIFSVNPFFVLRLSMYDLPVILDRYI